MAKLLITISDVKRIIFLLHRITALKIQIKALDINNNEHFGKLLKLEITLNFTESELKKFHDDDIEHIEKTLKEGYTENEISSMYKYYFNKTKRKLKRLNR